MSPSGGSEEYILATVCSRMENPGTLEQPDAFAGKVV